MTRQLPDSIPEAAKTALIRECFDEWPMHLQNCFETVRAAFIECVEKLVKQRFERYTNGGLCELVR